MINAATMPITDRETAQQFTDALHALMTGLTGHMRRETEALKAGDYAGGLSDAEAKADLVHAYRAALAHLKANKDALARFAPVKLVELRRLNTSFQSELQVNLAAVTTAKAVSEQLLTRLSDKVSAGKRPKTYNASGSMAQGRQGMPLAVDRAL